LREVEHAGNFKSNASPEFPEGRLSFLQRCSRDVCWVKIAPRAREREREREREGGRGEGKGHSVGEKMSERMVLIDPHGKYTQYLPTGVSGQ
jgi:hypothetical protein